MGSIFCHLIIEITDFSTFIIILFNHSQTTRLSAQTGNQCSAYHALNWHSQQSLLRWPSAWIRLISQCQNQKLGSTAPKRHGFFFCFFLCFFYRYCTYSVTKQSAHYFNINSARAFVLTSFPSNAWVYLVKAWGYWRTGMEVN